MGEIRVLSTFNSSLTEPPVIRWHTEIFYSLFHNVKKLAPTTYISIHTRHEAQFYQHQIWIHSTYNCVETNYYSAINAVTHTWRAFCKALNEKAPVNLAVSIWNAIPVKNCIHINLISKLTLLVTRGTQILGT